MVPRRASSDHSCPPIDPVHRNRISLTLGKMDLGDYGVMITSPVHSGCECAETADAIAGIGLLATGLPPGPHFPNHFSLLEPSRWSVPYIEATILQLCSR